MAISFEGHRAGYTATESGKRYRAECTCGYVSATRSTEMLAVGAVLHHIKTVRADLRRNGVSTTDADWDGSLQFGT